MRPSEPGPNPDPSQGEGEREACYAPMIDALTRRFPNVLADERSVPPHNSWSRSGSLIRIGATSAFSSLVQVSDAWPTTSQNSVSPNRPTPFPYSLLRPQQPGFTCQGNEFSLFMLLTSSFILNRFPS